MRLSTRAAGPSTRAAATTATSALESRSVRTAARARRAAAAARADLGVAPRKVRARPHLECPRTLLPAHTGWNVAAMTDVDPLYVRGVCGELALAVGGEGAWGEQGSGGRAHSLRQKHQRGLRTTLCCRRLLPGGQGARHLVLQCGRVGRGAAGGCGRACGKRAFPPLWRCAQCSPSVIRDGYGQQLDRTGAPLPCGTRLGTGRAPARAVNRHPRRALLPCTKGHAGMQRPPWSSGLAIRAHESGLCLWLTHLSSNQHVRREARACVHPCAPSDAPSPCLQACTLPTSTATRG